MTTPLQRALHWLAYVSALSALRTRLQPVMRILMFHGIGDAAHPVDLFETELRYLRRHLRVVPLDDVVGAMRAGKAIRHAVALTFDDGLRNHRTTVYPILERLGLPATFYVCPGLIEKARWLWPSEARERLRSMSPAAREELRREIDAPASDPKPIVEWMKSLDPSRRCSVEECIRRSTPSFEPTAEQRDQNDVMSWEDLCSMDPALVTVGSHTSSHPILPALPPAEVARELGESRRRLEERLGRPIEHFAYPNGAKSPGVIECAREHYRSAVTADRGAVRPGEDLLSLRRIPAPGQLPPFAWNMHRPTA